MIYDKRREILQLGKLRRLLKHTEELKLNKRLNAIQNYMPLSEVKMHVHISLSKWEKDKFKLVIEKAGNTDTSIFQNQEASLAKYEVCLREAIKDIVYKLSALAQSSVQYLSAILMVDQKERVWIVEFEECIFCGGCNEFQKGNCNNNHYSLPFEVAKEINVGSAGVSYVNFSSDIQNLEIHKLIAPDIYRVSTPLRSLYVQRYNSNEKTHSTARSDSNIKQRKHTASKSMAEINKKDPRGFFRVNPTIQSPKIFKNQEHLKTEWNQMLKKNPLMIQLPQTTNLDINEEEKTKEQTLFQTKSITKINKEKIENPSTLFKQYSTNIGITHLRPNCKIQRLKYINAKIAEKYKWTNPIPSLYKGDDAKSFSNKIYGQKRLKIARSSIIKYRSEKEESHTSRPIMVPFSQFSEESTVKRRLMLKCLINNPQRTRYSSNRKCISRAGSNLYEKPYRLLSSRVAQCENAKRSKSILIK